MCFIIMFFGRKPKMVAKCHLIWIFFNGALYYQVEFSNIEYEDGIFETYH